jgi:hypothetical protein
MAHLFFVKRANGNNTFAVEKGVALMVQFKPALPSGSNRESVFSLPPLADRRLRLEVLNVRCERITEVVKKTITMK